MTDCSMDRRVFICGAAAAVAGIGASAWAKGDAQPGKPLPPIQKVLGADREQYGWIWELPTQADWLAYFGWLDGLPDQRASAEANFVLRATSRVMDRLDTVIYDKSAPGDVRRAAQRAKDTLRWARRKLQDQVERDPEAAKTHQKRVQIITRGSPYVPDSVKRLTE